MVGTRDCGNSYELCRGITLFKAVLFTMKTMSVSTDVISNLYVLTQKWHSCHTTRGQLFWKKSKDAREVRQPVTEPQVLHASRSYG